MNLIKFPYYAETLDGMARVKFSNFYDFEILDASVHRIKELKNCKAQCSDSKFWRKCTADINKSFYYEVIQGTVILKELYTDVQINNQYIHFGKTLIKTGRVFVLWTR